MGRTTRKYSGPALDRYLRRFFASDTNLPTEVADRLAARCSSTFSSVRVRRQERAEQVPLASPDAPAAKPAPVAVVTAPEGTPPVTATAEGASEFDAYAIGLVPTFQREGRDGLIAKLGAVSSLDNLRKMARAQQIVLPEALRQGDVAIDTLRSAIADAVAKRIADRRAAAG